MPSPLSVGQVHQTPICSHLNHFTCGVILGPGCFSLIMKAPQRDREVWLMQLVLQHLA